MDVDAKIARLTREREEARIIARRLAVALETVLSINRHDEIEVLGNFRALPWA